MLEGLAIGFTSELSSAELFWNGGCWESLVQSLIVRTLTVDIPSSVEGLDFSYIPIRFRTRSIKMLTIGFLGGGNMAGALIGGLLAGGPRSDLKVHVTDLHEDKLARLAALGAQTHSGVGEWAASCDLMVFAVKPQGMKTALASLMPFLNPDGAALTIAAGIEAAAYADWLNGYPLMRAMPNTPAMVGMGVSGLWIPAGISDTAANAARQVLAAAGKVIEVKTEADIDLVGAIPGSGPAYVFRFMEALEKAGIKRGLPPEAAHALALGTVLGAAVLADKSGEAFSKLRENVTSKGGTTAKALEVMNNRDIDGMMDEAVNAALKRTAEMKALFR